ncbi:MAG: TRAP transporter large permease [Sedimentibacter sp.]|uniref:TRAP transporter large permease n=1 Tax=Sedimentibacter sp. TaxID=1960295 RepID=UPI0031590251
MDALIIFGSFALFIILNVPIGIAIGLSMLTFIGLTNALPLSFIATNMFTAADSFPLMAIPFFMLSGALMEGGGLSQRLVNVAESFVGHFTGGFAMVTIITCAFFGAISGSAPATVAAIGSIMYPAMLQRGYSKKFSAAVIAASGCLGVIIPPSIPMVIFGVATGASVGNLFVGGFGPGIVFAGGLMSLSYVICKKQGFKGNGLKFSFKRVFASLKEGIWALFVPVIILGGIYGGFFTPTEAAVVSVVYGFIAGRFIYKELTLEKIWNSLIGSSMTVGTVLIIVGTGTIFARVLTIARIPDQIVNGILSISDNPVVIIVMLNILLLFVGCVMETLAAIMILGPILAPVAAYAGMNLIHFGILMVVNLAVGFITPPVGVNLFVACGITKVSFEDLSKAILPFIMVLVVVLLIISFVPEITMWLPTMMNK